MSSVSTPQPITTTSTYAIGSPIGAPTASGSEGITPADVIRILKQRKLSIVITAAVVYALVAIATVLIGKYAPAYPSEAILELEPPPQGDPFMWQEGEVNTNYMEQLLRTEAAKIKNMELLLHVVSLPEIKATQYYRWYNSNAMEAAVGLDDDLGCAPVPETRLIRVVLACRDKAEAKLIVQKVWELYRNQYMEATESEAQARTAGLRDTLDRLDRELEQKRNQIKQLRESSNIPAMEQYVPDARRHVSSLREWLTNLGAEVASLETQKATLENVDPGTLPLTAEQELIIEADPMLRYLRSQVESLDVEIAARCKIVGPNHREVVMLQQRRQGFADKENAKREELNDGVRARQIESLEQQLEQNRQMLLQLQDQYAEVEAEERDMDSNIALYQEMMNDEERLGKQIEEVQRRLTEAEHAQRDQSRARLHLRQPPQEAIEPSRPNYPTYLGGGFLLALAAGLGVAFLRELTNQGVRTPVDVARFCHLSVLGCIPQLEDEEADVEEIEDAVRLAPQSLVAEAFRRARTNLQFSGPVETRRTLLITSPGPGDGKSAVAINLATTIAHGNLKVLLVDCNFRRPALRGAYPGTRPEGLSNILIGQGSLDEYVTKTDLPTLDVLTSGPMPPTPAELLSSDQMRKFIKQASERYDRVLLDGPPTLLISDATVLATLVDGVLLVSRAEENTRGVLRRAREQLVGLNVRIVGAILNGVKVKAGGYFKQQYREFYDYTSDETIPAELPEPLSGWDSEPPGADVTGTAGDPKDKG